MIMPSVVPTIEPRPPESEVPPMTVMAIAWSSYMQAHAALRRLAAGGKHDPGEAREQAGDGIDQHQVMFDVDARNARRLLVGADGVGAASVHACI